MKQQEVKSSSISHLGYEKGKLRITYARGATYEFDNVTEEQHKKLLGAKSLGKHLAGMGLKGKPINKTHQQ